MSEIPFGKHQGREIEEILEDDPEYIQWLMGQEWFLEKFPDLVEEIEALS